MSHLDKSVFGNFILFLFEVNGAAKLAEQISKWDKTCIFIARIETGCPHGIFLNVGHQFPRTKVRDGTMLWGYPQSPYEEKKEVNKI